MFKIKFKEYEIRWKSISRAHTFTHLNLFTYIHTYIHYNLNVPRYLNIYEQQENFKKIWLKSISKRQTSGISSGSILVTVTIGCISPSSSSPSSTSTSVLITRLKKVTNNSKLNYCFILLILKSLLYRFRFFVFFTFLILFLSFVLSFGFTVIIRNISLFLFLLFFY